MFGLESIALDPAAAGLGIARVEIQAMRARYEGQRFIQVAPELVGCACFTGIMAGNCQATSQLLARVLEAADIVTLPAMERDRDLREAADGFLDINAPLGILPCRTDEGVFLVFRGRGHGTSSNKAGIIKVVSSVNSVRTGNLVPVGRSSHQKHQLHAWMFRLSCYTFYLCPEPPCGLNVIQ